MKRTLTIFYLLTLCLPAFSYYIVDNARVVSVDGERGGRLINERLKNLQNAKYIDVNLSGYNGIRFYDVNHKRVAAIVNPVFVTYGQKWYQYREDLQHLSMQANILGFGPLVDISSLIELLISENLEDLRESVKRTAEMQIIQRYEGNVKEGIVFSLRLPTQQEIAREKAREKEAQKRAAAAQEAVRLKEREAKLREEEEREARRKVEVEEARVRQEEEQKKIEQRKERERIEQEERRKRRREQQQQDSLREVRFQQQIDSIKKFQYEKDSLEIILLDDFSKCENLRTINLRKSRTLTCAIANKAFNIDGYKNQSVYPKLIEIVVVKNKKCNKEWVKNRHLFNMNATVFYEAYVSKDYKKTVRKRQGKDPVYIQVLRFLLL